MKVSVIIPVVEEQEQHVRRLVSHIRTTSLGADYEILLLYPATFSRFLEVARFSNVRLVQVPEREIAALLNHGSREARGDILFFLHPECMVPAAAVHKIIAEVQKGSEAGGFCLKYQGKNPLSWLMAWFARFHQGGFHEGRRGLFVGRRLFRTVGGFFLHTKDPHRQLVRKLKASGARFSIIRDYITTSDFRWFSPVAADQSWAAKLRRGFTKLSEVLNGQALQQDQSSGAGPNTSVICKELPIENSRNTTG